MYHDAERIDLGPDSLLWRYAGDQRISFIGPTIGILQLMHPAIGAGVMEHSNFFGDPWGRIFRSLPRILGAVYDEDAGATGRIVRDFHREIKGVDEAGRRYHALDPDTFWWAHATFQFMAEQVADRFDTRRLTADQREQLYREGVEWYRRYGVSGRPVPPSRAAFQEEWDRVCAEVLEMNPAVEWVLGQLSRPRPPRLPMPLGIAAPVLRIGPVRRLAVEPLRVSAIGGMPAIVRARFDLAWSWRDQLELEAMERAVRNGWRLVPDVLRWHPTARAGWQRARRGAAAA
ncbi:MAG: hypothetical protein QOE35_397 [Actinomycetota bacterium]|jgi:uncharacterized protein (DUF2236 family)